MVPAAQRRSVAATAASLSGEQGREFVFTAAIPRERVASFLPRPFRAADVAPGMACLVASVRRFANLATDGADGPGALADLAVIVDPLGGTTGRHVYNLWWGTDRADVADRLAARTLHVAHLAKITVEEDGDHVSFDVPLPGGVRLDADLEHDTRGDASHTGWHARDGVVTRVGREADVRRARRGEGTLRAAPATTAARLLGGEAVRGSVVVRTLDTLESFERVTDA